MTSQMSDSDLHDLLSKMAEQIRGAHGALKPVSHVRDASDMREQLAGAMGQVGQADKLRLQGQLAASQQAMPEADAVSQLCERAHNFVAFDSQQSEEDGTKSEPEGSDKAEQPAPSEKPAEQPSRSKDQAASQSAESTPTRQQKQQSSPQSSHSDQSLIKALEAKGLTLVDVISAADKAHWVDGRINKLRQPLRNRQH